jgi:hypothetical protein
MPYKHRDPVSEDEMEAVEVMGEMEDVSDQRPVEVDDNGLTSKREMDRKRWEGHHTVCQTLRDIYHSTSDHDIRIKCRLAMAMAKAMNEKLKWYKHREEVKE